jgi:hypothetical protein
MYNMKVYAIVIESEEGVELLPNYFGTYKKALDEVKIKYPDWDDRYEDDGSLKTYKTENKVEVGEGYKMKDRAIGGDPNLTELYIERGIKISIRRLVKKPRQTAGGGGGYTRRRQSKRNTKNTRKI